MQKYHSYNILFALLLFACVACTQAAKPEIYSHKVRGALKGYDVVSYYSLKSGEPPLKGEKSIHYTWRNTRWHFANEDNKKQFITNPEKFLPQYGGYCAFAIAHGFKAPPRPTNWSIIQGKLYLNNNTTSHKKWLNEKDRKIKTGNENWTKMTHK